MRTIRHKLSTIINNENGVTGVFYPNALTQHDDSDTSLYRIEVWNHGKVVRDITFSGTYSEAYDVAEHEVRYFGHKGEN